MNHKSDSAVARVPTRARDYAAPLVQLLHLSPLRGPGLVARAQNDVTIDQFEQEHEAARSRRIAA
jgi:hypothetical protein